MDDDFNTAGALGQIFDFVKEINQARDEGADQESLSAAQAVLEELTSILGLELALQEKQTGEAEEFINLLIEIRKTLRDQKLWELSDLIRDKLLELEVVLEDNSQGTTWHWQ